MANWDSADLLQRLIDLLRLPTDDSGNLVTQDTTTTKLYRYLSDAQQTTYNDLNARIPRAFIGAPVLLTSSDGGYTYPIKDSTGATIYASGSSKVYARLEDIPDRPLIEGYHYTLEGDLLRIPHNRTWAFSTGPYIQPATEPVAITASQGLTLPTLCGPMILNKAAEMFSREGGLRDWTPYQETYANELASVCLRFNSAVWPSYPYSYVMPTSRVRLGTGGW